MPGLIIYKELKAFRESGCSYTQEIISDEYRQANIRFLKRTDMLFYTYLPGQDRTIGGLECLF